MLALSRKIGERILIGDDIVVSVLAVRGRQVCLGIEAPKNVPILRDELRARDAAEARQPRLASGSSKPTAETKHDLQLHAVPIH